MINKCCCFIPKTLLYKINHSGKIAPNLSMNTLQFVCIHRSLHRCCERQDIEKTSDFNQIARIDSSALLIKVGPICFKKFSHIEE